MCMWIYLPVVTILLNICMLKEHGVHFNQTNCTIRNASDSSLDWREIMSNKKHFLKKTNRIENLNIYAKEQMANVFFLCHIFFYKLFKFYKFIISVIINFEGFFWQSFFTSTSRWSFLPTILSKSYNKSIDTSISTRSICSS